MLQHFNISKTAHSRLGKSELPEHIVNAIARRHYPVDIPHIFLGVIFMGIVCRHEYSGIGRNVSFSPVAYKRSAALCAVKYLMMWISLGADNMILAMLLTHIHKINRQLFFTAYDRIVTEEQKNHSPYSYCYKFIISSIDLPVNRCYNTFNEYEITGGRLWTFQKYLPWDHPKAK